MTMIGRRVSRSSRRLRVTSDRQGAMLVFVGISMVTLMGFLALTLDVGAGGRQRRIAQTAADAAAIGGAIEIYRKHYDLVSSGATAEAVRNGFSAADVTVFYPPNTGPHKDDVAYVEVVINKSMPTIFGGLFGFAGLNVRTRAVAGVGAYSLNCIFSLDPDGAQAIEVKNGGELNTNCGITINSTDPNALDVNQSGTIDTDGGGIAISGNWTGNKTPSPAPSTGSVPVVNPLSYLTMPTLGACDHTGMLTITKDTVLSPGVYCGGIDLSTKTVNLQPGTYFIAGGGMHIANGGSVIGTGVTLVNTVHASYTYGPFYFGQGCKATLSAPTSGYWKGIVMFQDPAAPANVENVFACSSDDGPELTGIVYFPTQKITFDGSNTLTEIAGMVIAKNVEVSSKLSVYNDPSGNTTIQRFALVE